MLSSSRRLVPCLSLLHGALNEYKQLELPDPDDEALELAREYFDNCYQLMQDL